VTTETASYAASLDLIEVLAPKIFHDVLTHELWHVREGGSDLSAHEEAYATLAALRSSAEPFALFSMIAPILQSIPDAAPSPYSAHYFLAGLHWLLTELTKMSQDPAYRPRPFSDDLPYIVRDTSAFLPLLDLSDTEVTALADRLMRETWRPASAGVRH
jgi:hypothetical protein